MSLRKLNGKRPSPAGDESSSGWTVDEYTQIIEGVKRVYNAKIRPLEETYNFEGTVPEYTLESRFHVIHPIHVA